MKLYVNLEDIRWLNYYIELDSYFIHPSTATFVDRSTLIPFDTEVLL